MCRPALSIWAAPGLWDIKHVRAHWDDILRLASSIKQGTVTASLMLRKLGSYPRQNGLAVALRELGRIERTLFILDWLQSVELRRRVHAGLNKGEARNSLARAVFFNRLGEIRDRSFEQQRYRASGLNLVTAAIVLWNTVYLERATQGLVEAGKPVDGDRHAGIRAATHARRQWQPAEESAWLCLVSAACRYGSESMEHCHLACRGSGHAPDAGSPHRGETHDGPETV